MVTIKKRSLSKKRGFTLIELLIVIAIIGLLSSILIPNLSGAQNKAKEAAVKAVMYNLQTELESYHVDNFGYPDGSNLQVTELVQKLALSHVPLNPFTGQVYQPGDKAGAIIYAFDKDLGQYTLTGYKKDGQTTLYILTNT